jgi:anti-anti-sigma factor
MHDMHDEMETNSQFVRTAQRDGALWIEFITEKIGERETHIIAPVISEAIEHAPADTKAVVLDMRAITFLNSVGLGMCIDARNRSNARKTKIIMHGLNDELLALLKITRLDKVFVITNDDKSLAKAVA